MFRKPRRRTRKGALAGPSWRRGAGRLRSGFLPVSPGGRAGLDARQERPSLFPASFLERLEVQASIAEELGVAACGLCASALPGSSAQAAQKTNFSSATLATLPKTCPAKSRAFWLPDVDPQVDSRKRLAGLKGS